jgi:ABC-type phosphate/phosphonate transport system substrate-binding protein
MRALLVGVALLFGAMSFASAQERVLSFGVLNQQSPAKTAELWNPILHYLSDVTGLRFQLKMGATVQDTDAMMGRGEFDLLYTNHCFQKKYDGTYKVIARWAGPPIYGVIAVNADSPIKELKALSGKRVAFPSTGAFVAYAVPMAALRAAQVKVEPVYAGNQEGALAQLKARQVDAAAVNSRFLTRYAAKQRLRYREVFTSEAFADLPVVIHPRIPTAEADAIRNALLSMKHDPRATTMLERNSFSGFDAASDSDYDNARKIYAKIHE